MLGNPFWGRHAKGILDWIIVNAVLYLCLVAQITDFIEGLDLWWYCAGGYAALVVLHAILSQRDGYTISLSYSMGRFFRKCYLIPIAWIFELFGTSSARPPALQHMQPYNLKVGWWSLFYLCMIAICFCLMNNSR